MPPDTFPSTVAELVLDGLPVQVQRQVFLLLCERGHLNLSETLAWAERTAETYCPARLRSGARCTAQTGPGLCRTHWRMEREGRLPDLFDEDDWTRLDFLADAVAQRVQAVKAS